MVENTVYELALGSVAAPGNRRNTRDMTNHRMGSHLACIVHGGRWLSVARIMTLTPCRAMPELDRLIFLPGYSR